MFNWSEVHFYRSTSYKIHTLADFPNSTCDNLLAIFYYIFPHCVLCIFERKFLNWYLEWQQQANCCSDCSSSKICVKICILYIRVPTLFFQPFTIIQILILFLSVQIWYNLVYFSGGIFFGQNQSRFEWQPIWKQYFEIMSYFYALKWQKV